MARASPPSLPGCAAGAEHEGIAFQRLVFPQYQEESSALLRMYLSGAVWATKPGDVNAYAASTLLRGGPVCLLQAGTGGGYYEAGRADAGGPVHHLQRGPSVQQAAPGGAAGVLPAGCLTLNMAGWACRNRTWCSTWTCPRSGRWTCSASGRGTPTHRGTSMRPTAPIWPPAGRPPWRRPSDMAGPRFPAWIRRGRLRRIDEIHQDIWQAVRPLLETKER